MKNVLLTLTQSIKKNLQKVTVEFMSYIQYNYTCHMHGYCIFNVCLAYLVFLK